MIEQIDRGTARFQQRGTFVFGISLQTLHLCVVVWHMNENALSLATNGPGTLSESSGQRARTSRGRRAQGANDELDGREHARCSLLRANVVPRQQLRIPAICAALKPQLVFVSQQATAFSDTLVLVQFSRVAFLGAGLVYGTIRLGSITKRETQAAEERARHDEQAAAKAAAARECACV